MQLLKALITILAIAVAVPALIGLFITFVIARIGHDIDHDEEDCL